MTAARPRRQERRSRAPAPSRQRQRPDRRDPAQPEVVVAANGGSDLVYLPDGDKALAAKVVAALAAQDYASGLFVDDSLGQHPRHPAAVRDRAEGTAVTPSPPSRSTSAPSTRVRRPHRCGVEVADTGLQQGQGMHGWFCRADTRNSWAPPGPASGPAS